MLHSTAKKAVLLGILFGTAVASLAQQGPLPLKPDSTRFAVMGDMGTGARPQYEVGTLMAARRETFPFEFVLLLGDNLYGSQKPSDFVKKFELPYKLLLDGGVKFYAALGNHDVPSKDQPYRLFNMGGQRYYTFKGKGNVRFFALDSNYMDKKQLEWLDKELRDSGSAWKICFFHHPLYSSGGTHGSNAELRAILEPLFLKYAVNVVFSGHDHFYERIKPQKGIYYFVSGSGGQLRRGDITRTELTAKGFDQDQSFMLVEIAGEELYFQAIARDGHTIDSGVILRPNAKATSDGPAVSAARSMSAPH